MKKDKPSNTNESDILAELYAAHAQLVESKEESDEAICALRTMFQCARKGTPKVMHVFADLVPKGNPSGMRLASYYIHKAAELGYKYSIFELIEYYWCRNREVAINWIKKARSAGLYKDLLNLALNLGTRSGIFSIFTDNILEGNCDADVDNEIALYIFEHVPHRDTEQSLCYAELLAETNVEKALRIVHAALKNEAYDTRLDKIVELCEHENSYLVEQAHKELQGMANRGYLDAMYRLAYSYYWGKSGYEKDARKAFKWWKMCADRGDATAMHEISVLYIDGEGTRKNYKKAFQYAKSSAEAGDADGLNQLGFCLYWGYGTERDFVAAVDCFRRAIDRGETIVAAHNLAERYRTGEGVNQDFEQALLYHNMAARKKYPDSICCIGIMHVQGQGMPVNYKEGVRLLRRAVKLGSTLALFELGKCYENGLGVRENWHKALSLYEQSLESLDDSPKAFISRLKRKLALREKRI